MKLDSIILKTGDAVGHLVSAGLALDAVNNASQGNYKLAVAEGIVSAYIQVSKYFDRRKKHLIAEFSDRVHNEYVPQMQAMTDRINSSFNRLFENMDYSK